jgi:hypothetical protein
MTLTSLCEAGLNHPSMDEIARLFGQMQLNRRHSSLNKPPDEGTPEVSANST